MLYEYMIKPTEYIKNIKITKHILEKSHSLLYYLKLNFIFNRSFHFITRQSVINY